MPNSVNWSSYLVHSAIVSHFIPYLYINRTRSLAQFRINQDIAIYKMLYLSHHRANNLTQTFGDISSTTARIPEVDYSVAIDVDCFFCPTQETEDIGGES